MLRLCRMENTTLVFGLVIMTTIGSAACLYTPKTLKVDCLSTDSEEEFKNRLRVRANAEDKTTIWLFKGEELVINFDLPKAAAVEVLDIRYSNDGDIDEIGVSLDNKALGQFETSRTYAWGNLWNKFMSSGPIGGLQNLNAGKHSVTIKIMDSDEYGVEIDYIRLNVLGAALQSREDFVCVHRRKDDD